jgi:hypothetical protein
MKFRYPITSNYVAEWKLAHAVREIIANAIDSETEHGANFSVKYDADKSQLTVRNENIKINPKSLYFGESSKRGVHYIGQYGEGLKLAMLVFARDGIDVTIKNGDETWKPLIEKDNLGVETLCINITKTKRTTNNFEVIIHGINKEFWEMIQSWFLRLSPPNSVHKTSAGELIDDSRFIGKIYVRGVYVTTRNKYTFGYNFFNVDTGRDRRIPSNYDINLAISKMWNEIAKREDSKLIARMYKSFEQEAAEQEVFAYIAPESLIDAMLSQFRKEYGENAVPVVGTAEGSSLEHLGYTPVPLAPKLVNLLRYRLPTPEQISKEYSEKIETRFPLYALTENERSNLFAALDLIRPYVKDAINRVAIVRFASEKVEGLHNGNQISIARSTLSNFGKLVTLLVHEFAHDFGEDGTVSHIAAIHKINEAVINSLWARASSNQTSVPLGT